MNDNVKIVVWLVVIGSIVWIYGVGCVAIAGPKIGQLLFWLPIGSLCIWQLRREKRKQRAGVAAFMKRPRPKSSADDAGRLG